MSDSRLCRYPLASPSLVGLIAVDAAGQELTRAYVANRGATTVTVVDVVTGAVDEDDRAGRAAVRRRRDR